MARQRQPQGKDPNDGPAENSAQAKGSALEAPQSQGSAIGNGGGRKPPVFECRLQRVKAVVWSNFSPAHGEWFSITIGRSYQDESKTWRTANSFGRDDLLIVAECVRQCYLWIASKQQNGNVQQVAGTATNSNAPSSSTEGGNGSDIPF